MVAELLGQALMRLGTRRADLMLTHEGKALRQLHTVNPRTITVDKNPAYPAAVEQRRRRTNCGASPACVSASFSKTLRNKTTGA